MITVVCTIIRNKVNSTIIIALAILLLTNVFMKVTDITIGYSIILTTRALCTSRIIYFISTFLSGIQNDNITFLIICAIKRSRRNKSRISRKAKRKVDEKLEIILNDN